MSNTYQAYASDRAQARLQEAGIPFQVVGRGVITLRGGHPFGREGRMWQGGMWTFILAPSTPENPIRTLRRIKDD